MVTRRANPGQTALTEQQRGTVETKCGTDVLARTITEQMLMVFQHSRQEYRQLEQGLKCNAHDYEQLQTSLQQHIRAQLLDAQQKCIPQNIDAISECINQAKTAFLKENQAILSRYPGADEAFAMVAVGVWHDFEAQALEDLRSTRRGVKSRADMKPEKRERASGTFDAETIKRMTHIRDNLAQEILIATGEGSEMLRGNPSVFRIFQDGLAMLFPTELWETPAAFQKAALASELYVHQQLEMEGIEEASVNSFYTKLRDTLINTALGNKAATNRTLH